MTALDLVGQGVSLASLSLPLLWLISRAESEPASRHRRLVLALGCANALLFAPLLWAQVPDVGGRPAAMLQSLVAVAPGAVVSERPLSVLSIVAIAWLVACALALFRTLLDAVKLRALLKRARPAPQADVELAAALARQLSLFAPRLLESDEVAVPCATSPGDPVIVLPRGLRAQLSDQAFSCVLTHEMRHLERRDETWALVVALLRVPFALHPVTKKLTAEISLAREEAVDALVACGDAHTYATTLLEVARLANSRPGYPGAVFMGAHGLQRRVAMLTNPQKRPRARLLTLFAVTAVLAGVGITASPASAAMPRGDTAENALLDSAWPASVAEECPKVMTPLSLRLGADTTLPFKGVKRSEIANANVAESCVSRDGTVHVTGRAWGSTTITVWTDEGVATYPLSID